MSYTSTNVQANASTDLSLNSLSGICHVLGYLSIVASIAVWFVAQAESAESIAHAERLGIFIGMWAPTFFILSHKYADK